MAAKLAHKKKSGVGISSGKAHKTAALGDLSTKGWATSAQGKNIDLSRTPLNVFLRETDADRLAALEELERFGLPRYRVVEMSVGSFLSDPERFGRLLRNRGNLYYPKVFTENGDRHFLLGCTWDEAVSFYMEQLNIGFVAKDSKAMLSEFFENKYGFSLICNGEGGILLEICRGLHAELGWGRQTPIFVARNSALGTMHYEFPVVPLSKKEFDLLRSATLSILAAMPKTNTEHCRFEISAPMPSYSEGVLVSLPDNTPLSPLFFDLRREEAYQYRVDFRLSSAG